MAVIARTADQWGQKAARDNEKAREMLGGLMGPLPRQAYESIDDAELAKQIVQRWTAKRLDMSQRIALDQRLMRYMDPEKVQDHWSDFWTGASRKKLQHSTTLTIGVFNYPRAIVEALTGLLTGADDGLAYTCDVIPRNSLDDVQRIRAQVVDNFVQGWISESEYERTFMRAGSNLYALGRNWKGVITQTEPGPFKNMAKVMNASAGSIASFWHENHETLECVIVASEMLPGVAAAMYPGNDAKIMRALHSPSAWLRNLGVANQVINTWDLSSTVSVLTCWFRTTKNTIGQVVVLMDSPMSATNNGRSSSVMLDKKLNSGYPDIPWRCTPRFPTNDRPPDEAMGALYDIAPIATMYDEVVSAAKDMLYRAIYQRYKLTNAYGRPPNLIPNTSILALRAGQDLQRLDDVINNVPVDTFIARLEELLIILPGLSRYFLGQAPPSETSGEAITAAINASIQRQISTRTEVRIDERWMYRQIVGQARAFGSWVVDGETVNLTQTLGRPGDFDFVIRWDSDNPKDAVKAKQLALAALRAGVISLDTAQATWGITNTQDEQRKIKQGMSDVTLRPDMVALTEQALQSRANRKRLEAAAMNPNPPPPPVKISLSGPLDPVTAHALAGGAGGATSTQADSPAPGTGGEASAASATVGANMRPPAFENDNDRGLPPSQAGDTGQP